MFNRSAADESDRILTHEEIKLLFSNIELIVGVNQEALRQLLTKVNECVYPCRWMPPPLF